MMDRREFAIEFFDRPGDEAFIVRDADGGFYLRDGHTDYSLDPGFVRRALEGCVAAGNMTHATMREILGEALQ